MDIGVEKSACADVKERIFRCILKAQTIVLSRHLRPDGDAVGSTKGLAALLRAAFPDKRVLVINSDRAAYLAFTGEEDAPIPPEEYRDALVLCLDCATTERLANPPALTGGTVIKIDHHPDVEPYGYISWVEPDFSSTCEMVTDFYLTFSDRLVLTREAAEYLYLGIVTDSGRFRFREVTGDTLRRAAALLDVGIDTERLYANLYLDDAAKLRLQAYVYSHMKISENGVASVYLSLKTQERLGMDYETAGSMVTALDGIRGSLIWAAFIEFRETEGERAGLVSVRVRLRSRFVAIDGLASRYRGGGHACASGATVHSRREANRLLGEADELLKEYKKNHEGWL